MYLTIGSLLKYRPRKRETTPRTAAVRNDSFKVRSSGMLKDSSSSGSLNEPEAGVCSQWDLVTKLDKYCTVTQGRVKS